jgi:hypothetical protein
MPDLIPYSQQAGFIPSHQNNHRPSFAESAALFAYGEVDAVLVELIREERQRRRLTASHASPSTHTQHPTLAAAVREKAAANHA